MEEFTSFDHFFSLLFLDPCTSAFSLTSLVFLVASSFIEPPCSCFVCQDSEGKRWHSRSSKNSSFSLCKCNSTRGGIVSTLLFQILGLVNIVVVQFVTSSKKYL